jgi:histidinol-phosphate aminotransferase
LVTVPTNHFVHDLDATLAAITPRTRLIFVANPNNPTGTIVSPNALSGFLESVPEHIVVALDEAYFEFLEAPPDLLPNIRMSRKPNVLLMRTFSKIYGLAGLRIGYAIGHADLIASLEKVRQPFNVNSLAQAAALAALDDISHVERTRKVNARGQRFFKQAFRRLKLEYVPSAANFVLVRVGDGQLVFGELQKAGVIVRPMTGYQLPEWIRISIGTARQNQRCLESLKTVLGLKSAAV